MGQIKKIMSIGDVHIDDRTPSSRKDDYFITVLGKVEECFKLAIKRKVDAIFFVGDIFNRMEVAGKCRNSLIALLMKMKDRIPIYVVVGNHDTKSTLSNIPNSTLGTLIETGLVQYTDYVEDLDIALGHYKPLIEQDLKNGCYEDKECLIWIFHANISNTPMMFDHVLFQDIPLNKKVRLVIGGHLHREMTDVNSHGVKFVNSGSISRNEMNEYHLSHMPGVLIVEYDKEERLVETEIVKLSSAMASDEIFKIEEARTKKDNKNDMEQYMQQISHLSNWTFGENKYDSLRNAGQIKKIDPEIVDLAIKTLEEINANK